MTLFITQLLSAQLTEVADLLINQSVLYCFFFFCIFFNFSCHFCSSCLLPLLLHPFAASDRQHGDSLRQGYRQD